MLRIKSFYQKIQPQTILEEVLNFSLQGEIFFDEEYSCKRFAIVPYGNRLYTGAIQALGFHYLNTTELDTVIILSASDSVDTPIITTQETTEPIMGEKIKINQTLQEKFKNICKRDDNMVSKNKAIVSQLPFIRVLSNLKIFPIIVPSNTYSQDLEDVIKTITKESPKVGILCVTNHEYNTHKKNVETQDKKIINKLTSHTKASRHKNTAHLQLFYNITKQRKHDLQLVLYTNTANTKNKKTTSHYCMVG